MSQQDQVTLARLSTVLSEAIALLQEQHKTVQQVVETAERTLALMEAEKASDRFFDLPAAEHMTGFDARQLKKYRENGTFKSGVHYRDVRSTGAATGTYQYNPAAINRLFRQPAEKRA